MSDLPNEPLRDIEAEDAPPKCPECGYGMTSNGDGGWFCEDCGIYRGEMP
jgi:tRNA(Ile2) C34 agmatinyltransferase TiaS